ncbi:hypothetical protein ACH5RR_030617 [Cinchona calisaya]|uniref:Reverse transcriptase zinc-binding domain-containing protein n=1 Tax=Cinchona calisaya TaxID=153742 RepID=A0ABD2YWC7_9GENT
MTTKGRMRKWGMQVDPKYIFCGASEESMDHIFFECIETYKVWRKVMSLCFIHKRKCGLAEDQKWMSKRWCKDTFANRLKKIVLAATVYYIWAARNRFIFQHIPATTKQMLTSIMNTVQENIVSWRGIPKTKINWDLVMEWSLWHRIFYDV